MTRLLLLLPLVTAAQNSAAADSAFKLQPEDHVCYIGNTTADRMQHHAWLETYIHALHREHNLTFRNLGFPGDEIKRRSRSENFGSPDQWLSKTKANVVFCFFGYNEAFAGQAGLKGFENDLAEMIDHMRSQQYNGKSPPRLVVFSPIAHENLQSRHLPDGSANNRNLALYTESMRRVCEQKNVRFVDLFHPTQKLYENADKPLTLNGIHLLDHGNRALADVVARELFGKTPEASEEQLLRLREAVLDKNYHWFSRYRVVDGYNVYGGRSKLAWFGQSNADVMKREMEMFDVMTANRDERVWAVARGSDLKVVDDNLPPALPVKSNKPGPLDGERHPYYGGKEAIKKMTVAKGMKVNLYASEEMFPEMVNPVQMAVDTAGRLFVSVWPSYPHWNPEEPRRDRIVCLPDEDSDGVADKCVVFADKLNSITGFEFWGGGMLVAAPPEIWFLKDTDGDDRADVKIRMLQGVSSADSHHSANAMVIGPDGWLYWSRGIFNVATMETPTQTYRSTKTGVHRFNPRTFEMEFHFPIGPNPHGDVFDQWGYQFANDGTSGTGSYVNIGKGVGNKQWFKKRVRPVAATGILSSSHFPEENNGNFLICNTIGFLGVLQHEVHYNGADITAEEIEPIVYSSDPNFRPTDLEIGADGALYVSDWCNVLIGHMQHNMRDPNRDHSHGRIYRVTCQGRPLLEPVRLKGKPISEVCKAFFAKENGVRYRARLELSGRKTEDVVDFMNEWTQKLDPADPSDAQALLECLWVFEEHRVPNLTLVRKVFLAEEPRVRAAAIRTLGHWAQRVSDAESTLLAGARDLSALVRAEAVKAAVDFQGPVAAEVYFEVANRETDPELQTVLKYARGQIDADRSVRDAIASGGTLSTAAKTYALRNAKVDDLLKMERSEAVYEAVLARTDAPLAALRTALDGLAALKKSNQLEMLLKLIEQRDATGSGESLGSLGRLLVEQQPADLKNVRSRVSRLARQAKRDVTRRYAFAAWMVADGSGDAAFFGASKDSSSLRDVLEAVALTPEATRANLYDNVKSLIFELPPGVKSSQVGARQYGVNVDFYYPSGKDVAVETLAAMQPKASGVVKRITINVPQRKQKDRFALQFSGFVLVPQSGKYTFAVTSDDGSRIYIDDQLLVNNDGLHGMKRKAAAVELSAGPHSLVVTYFDNGGGDGLRVTWYGPGFKEQQIPGDRLAVSVGESLHEIAIRALATIPGCEERKVNDLADVVKAGKHRAAAISVLKDVPIQYWPQARVQSFVDNMLGYLSRMPAQRRTGSDAQNAVALAAALAKRLPSDRSKSLLDRLQNLDVPVIAIGTVPHRMIYDKERIAVQAGKAVEFRFSNTDNMPHNFAIVLPGAMEEVGQLAEATARDADAMARHYIPESDKILLASKLLQPGDNQALSFVAPKTPGVYPYVCTYPGHWRRMHGALYVVKDLDAYQADRSAYLASHPLPVRDELLKYIGRNTEWKFDDLIADVSPLPPGRSYEVGRNLFKVANCVGCHKLNGEGQELGPDLTKIEAKKHTTDHLLRSLLEPSKEIADKYKSHVFALDSGDLVTGMIVEETPSAVRVLVDPLAKAAPVAIDKSRIEARKQSPTSIMPLGLANKLTREEILDLIAYVFAKGDIKHKLFADHAHQHEHGRH